MKNRIKQVVEKLIYGPLSPMMSFTFQFISNLEYRYFTKKWGRQGWKQPDQAEVDFEKALAIRAARVDNKNRPGTGPGR